METGQQRHERILQDIRQARNRVVAGDNAKALEIIASIGDELHGKPGQGEAYVLLLAAYG